MSHLSDYLSVHETSHLKSPHYQRRNAISIPVRKSSLDHNYPSFDGKTSFFPPPPPAPPAPTEAQMNKMKQLMCTAIQQLRTLTGQLKDAEASAAHWQKKYAELEARHDRLVATHHDSLVALKTTRRLLLSSRREKFELRRR